MHASSALAHLGTCHTNHLPQKEGGQGNGHSSGCHKGTDHGQGEVRLAAGMGPGLQRGQQQGGLQAQVDTHTPVSVQSGNSKSVESANGGTARTHCAAQLATGLPGEVSGSHKNCHSIPHTGMKASCGAGAQDAMHMSHAREVHRTMRPRLQLLLRSPLTAKADPRQA